MATDTDAALKIERDYDATPERVFQAWLDPELVKQWYAPSDEMTVPVAEIDAREGGAYRIVMSQGDEQFDVRGIYREIVAPSKLVFTWAWQTAPEDETLVTVEIAESDRGCKLTLTHEGLTDPESRGRHEQGWSGCLDRLAQVS